MAETVTDERQQQLDALAEFAATAPGSSKGELTPALTFSSPVDRVFGAQKVAVLRDEERVFQRLKVLANAAGSDWYYRWQVKGEGGKTEWVEGPSIKLADDLIRVFGNCDLDTRVMDVGDSWVFYSRFIDLETGASRTRPYQQRKAQRTSKKMDADRSRDIAFQIGTSKAERNVVVHALRIYANFAFEEAKNSLVKKIGADLSKWRNGVLEALAKQKIDKARVERVMARTSDEWLAPDVAKIIATMKAIADGMATWDESFPGLDQSVDETSDHTDTSGASVMDQAAANKDTSSTKQIDPVRAEKSDPASGSVKPADPTAETKADAPETKADKSAADAKPAVAALDSLKTQADYVAYADAWIEAETNADAGDKRWKDEKNKRNTLNVEPDQRRALEIRKNAKMAKLRETNEG